MKILIDPRPKKNHAIRDSFLNLPDNLTAKQTKALNDLKKLLKWELKEKVDAKVD